MNSIRKKIKFDVLGLHNLFHGLQGELGLESIRLRTDRDDLFTTYQLEHAANRHNPFEPDSFTGQLKKVLDDISWFSFRFYKNDNSKEVKIFFDLRASTVGLEAFHGIAPEEVEDLLLRSFPKKIFIWRKFTKIIASVFVWVRDHVVAAIISGVILALILAWLGLKG